MHFYDDENNVYVTHVDAIRSKRKCKLYYEDAFFDTVDWKTIPTISLPELYKLRAEEIRSKYEYVVLCLSGGVDSRNVFESFYHNNILIDEILCVGAYSEDQFSGSDENNNDEIHNNVKALLKDAVLPNTKITYFDYSKLFSKPKDFTLLQNFGNDWAYELPYFKSFHHFFWYDLSKHLNIPDSKKACYVMGTGKTRLGLNSEGKPFTNFRESDLMDYGARYQVGNLSRENFYFAPTHLGAEIMKKQASVMYDYMNIMKDKELFFKQYEWTYPNIVYNLKCPLVTPTRKSKQAFMSHRDTFMKRHSDSELYKIWYDGLQKLSGDIGLNYMPHYSKPYFLG